MGHCDSSTQFGGHGEILAAGRRSAEAAASHGVSRTPARGELAAVSRSVAGGILLALIRGYKIFLAPFLGGACKYYPSCSNYAYEAVARHGARRGLVLALKRLGRCRPFTQGGFDPVPDCNDPAGEREADVPALGVSAKEPVR
jgi:uncharacterized protein